MHNLMHNVRSWAFMAGLLSAMPILAVAAAGSGGGTAPAMNTASKQALRIGLITPSTGTYATYGQLNRSAVEFAVKQANANGGVDGHKVEIFKADTGGTASGAVTAAQKVVEQDHAQFLIGLVATPVSQAVSSKLSSLNAMLVATTSQGVKLTGALCNSRFFRTNPNDNMAIDTIDAWLDKQPQKSGTWDIVAADYEYGHDSVAAFKKELKKTGGKLNKVLFPPLGTSDFGSYIGQLNGGDGLLLVDSGNDIINFYKQAFQFGLLKKYGVVIASAGGINGATIEGVGPKLAGQLGEILWSPSVPTPESKAFVAAWKKAHNDKAPGQFVGDAYVGTQFLFAAVKAAHSVDPAAVAKAGAGLKFDSLYGQVTMRAADHQLLGPTYIVKVVKKSDGSLGLKTLMTLPASKTTPKANPACHMKS